MTNEKIIDKIIKKAIYNNWKLPQSWLDVDMELYDYYIIEADYNKYTIICNFVDHKINFHINEIIFDSDFAKAFWGEKKECKCSGICIQYQGCSCGSKQSGWQYHLQQMVLEENPLQYLERFL